MNQFNWIDSQERRTKDALAYLTSSHDNLDQLLVAINRFFDEPSQTLTFAEVENIGVLALVDKLSEVNELVALYQTMKVTCDRHTLRRVGSLIKFRLARISNRNLAPGRKRSAKFTASLLSSDQHLALILSWLNSAIETGAFDEIEFEQSLENDWLYWTVGIPQHRQSIIEAKLLDNVSGLRAEGYRLWRCNSTLVKVSFIDSQSWWKVSVSPLVVFRLEDLHPNIESSVNATAYHNSGFVITIPARGLIERGRYSHGTLVYPGHSDKREDHYKFASRVPLRESTLKIYSQLRENKTNEKKIVAAYSGDRCLHALQQMHDDFWHHLNEVLDSDKNFKFCLYGCTKPTIVSDLIKKNLPARLHAQLYAYGLSKMEDVLENAFCFFALPVDGGLHAMAHFAANDIPILALGGKTDINKYLDEIGSVETAFYALKEINSSEGAKSQFLKKQRSNWFPPTSHYFELFSKITHEAEKIRGLNNFNSTDFGNDSNSLGSVDT